MSESVQTVNPYQKRLFAVSEEIRELEKPTNNANSLSNAKRSKLLKLYGERRALEKKLTALNRLTR